MSQAFFAELEPVADYGLLTESRYYKELPPDWVVVLADVKNSTEAIDAGQYKDVNMIGVSCIVAVQNALGAVSFPYIFGGDGATLAVPESAIERTMQALGHTRAVAREQLGLELRIAVIPAADILKAGAQLTVAKLKISDQQDLALVRGDGWSLADTWMKEREADFNLSEDVALAGSGGGDLNGLECRWNPLPARKFQVLALIVQARQEGEGATQIYRDILREVIGGELRPISLTELRLAWPPKYLVQEAKMRCKSAMQRLAYLAKTYAVSLGHTLILWWRGSRNVTEPIEYLRELTQNTDYLKFDGALRMIVDVSKAQKERLLRLLDEHYRNGEIFYGHHADPCALMTCYIQGPHKHIHFVDAGGGGYAMAAKQLKAQKRAIDHPGHARLLGRIDLFKGLDRVTLAKLAAYLQPLSYKSGSVIFSQAEAGDALYLVASGSVGVYTKDTSGAAETRVKVLASGEPFGEMALLTDSPRTASIKAESDCEVLRLERSAFLDLVKQQPSVALAIAATLSRRLAGMLNQSGQADTSAPPPAAKKAPAAARVRWQPGRAGTALIAAVAMLTIGWAVPPPPGMSVNGWHALAVLLAALPALALDVLLEGVLGFLLLGAWVLSGVVPAGVALSGFGSTSWVLVVAVLIVGAAITASGVLYRLALETIDRMRGGFPGEVCALGIAGLLMGPAVPNATSRVIIIAPMLRELIEALGYRLQSNAAAGLSMAVLIGFGQMAAVFLTSSTTAVLVAAVLPQPARDEINWITWALYGAPINLILFAGLLASLLWLYRPGTDEAPNAGVRNSSLALQRALLGPMSRNEKISLAVGIGLLVGFVTQPLHGADPAWIAVLATGVLAATRVATVETLRAVNWNFALLFGVLISLAAVFKQTGLDRWMADRVAAAVGDLSAEPIVFVVVLALLCFAISFIVRWQAAAPLITIALAPVAAAAGMHPFVVGVIATIAGNGFFLPYQSTTYLALYAGTGGKVFTHAQARSAALAYGAWTLLAAVLSVPIWRLMGLL